MSLKYFSDSHLKPGAYVANLQALALDPTNAVISQAVTLRIVVPAVTLKIGETDTLRIRLIRRWPFAAATGIIPMSFRVTSDSVPTQVPEANNAELYVADGVSKDVIQNGSIRAYFCDPATGRTQSAPEASKSNSWWRRWSSHSVPPGGCVEGGYGSNVTTATGAAQGVLSGKLFQVEPSVPSNVKEASGVIRLHSSEFSSDLELPATLLVKDWWLYAAMAVFLGQWLSFAVNNWINTGRQRKLNKLDMAPVESGLVNLLLRRPDLESQDNVALINTFLNNAVQANKLGEVEAAKSSIKAAQERLDELKRVPSPAVTPNPPSPALLMLESGYAYAGRRLNFVVMNPDSTCGRYRCVQVGMLLPDYPEPHIVFKVSWGF